MPDTFFNIHGVGLRFCTDSPAVAAAMDGLLGHFRSEGSEVATDLELSVREVRSRSEVTATVCPTAPVRFASTGSAAGIRLLGPWPCTIYREEGGRIVDFHEHGLLRIDDRHGRGQGFVAQPE